ncbi:hypothetical protein [Amycolatopsis thailandensis]|uniref:hypothetical protein n=1 Tax=Amycolatopsis thailandensis TaxID=589330 RepID=UPI001178331E|nr:hypothetical protein [Amycolatopsis thailandensis]
MLITLSFSYVTNRGWNFQQRDDGEPVIESNNLSADNAARWSCVRELSGPGPHGHPVEVVTGIVDTPDGPVPALRVGISVVMLDETLTGNLITNVLRAKHAAGLNREDPRP